MPSLEHTGELSTATSPVEIQGPIYATQMAEVPAAVLDSVRMSLALSEKGLLDKKSWHDQFDILAKQVIDNNYETPLSLLFLDLDSFKEVNDVYGHDVGDSLLISVGGMVADLQNLPGHAGGDEFVLAVETDEVGIESLEQELRQSLAAFKALPENAQFSILGMSIGRATLREGMSGSDLLRAADRAMYRNKTEQVPLHDESHRERFIRAAEELLAVCAEIDPQIRPREVGKYMVAYGLISTGTETA